MKISAIIQARISSSRLPGKVMKLLLGKPVLWHVINRVSKAQSVDELIIATTVKAEDDIIEDFCRKNNVLVFRGSEDDVLDRYYRCAEKYNMTNIVRITADCPLHDPCVIDFVVREYVNCGYDYVSNIITYTFPDGLDVEVFSLAALKDCWENARLPSEREHVTSYIRKHTKFKSKNVSSTKKWPIYRLTLDHPEDYEFIKRIYEGIGKLIFNLEDIVALLEADPKLLKINQHFIMNEGYLKSLKLDGESQNAEL